ncbi:urease accessory protein UreF [Sulfobacillus thermosulfidooxidans]|uniref:urease accessory protein UreF n=1 Tax=Sulfobacillus thermosulfidooxidans TaxID=28034 RepID=UPI0006B46DF9|nr:urease accessory UreF family protein [Sulfobacillus thermosulfidooxidans]
MFSDTTKVGEMLQFLDGLFPSGAFTHSFGLETLVQEGWITDAQTAKYWLEAIIQDSWVPSDGLAALLVFQALGQASFLDGVARIDAYLTATRTAFESQKASLTIGRRILATAEELLDEPDLSIYQQYTLSRPSLGNQTVIIALIGGIRHWGCEATLQGIIYFTLSGYVQALLRLVPLGQREAQKLLFELKPWTMDVLKGVRKQIDFLSVEDIGSSMPVYDIAVMRHKDLYSRLFRS